MNNKHSRTSIFLIELIIAVLLFSISAAVCAKLFANTHIKSKETIALNHAVSEAQDAAELMRGSDIRNYEELLNLYYKKYPMSKLTQEYALKIGFDKDFNNCAIGGTDEYNMTLFFTYDEQFLTLDITYTNVAEGRVIYSLSLQKHLD